MVEKARYLGVTIDTQLTWAEHINERGRKANQKLGVLGPSFSEKWAVYQKQRAYL
jgi:hypothetical protein